MAKKQPSFAVRTGMWTQEQEDLQIWMSNPGRSNMDPPSSPSQTPARQLKDNPVYYDRKGGSTRS